MLVSVGVFVMLATGIGPDRALGLTVTGHHVGAAALDGSLYVVGGRGKSDFSFGHTERFDPRTGRWETLAELPQGSGGLSGSRGRE